MANLLIRPHRADLRRADSGRNGEIELVMVAAAGIEGRAAGWASVATRHVLLDGHFLSARPTKHGGLSPFRARPHLDGVVGQCLVAVLACVVDAATFHLDGKDVEYAAVVSATRVRIEVDPANFGA
jgi:hypothetical protein